jgi:protoheme IX farnesyltransferase
MLSGLALIIASACVFNNYTDRGIDSHMARTKHRALVEGTISGRAALIYATVLGLTGSLILGRFTNLLTLGIALTGLFAYVVLYGLAKRRSVYGTEVGSVSGAIPPVVGYVAVTGRLDAGAFILFLILVLWQMPHFYAIAMYRLKDYSAAGLPVLPVKKGARVTKFRILAYIMAFTVAMLMLPAFGYVGYTYLVVATLLALTWLAFAIQTLRTYDDRSWGRHMFFYSLFVLMTLCITISLSAWLP